ncbi:hypothetical protein SALBM135S_04295 [Streptomyces alboniger]
MLRRPPANSSSRRSTCSASTAPHDCGGAAAPAIGPITPELDNPIFPALAQVIAQALTRQGYTPALATQTPGGSTEDELTEMLVDRGVSGIIFVSGLHADTTADMERYEAPRGKGVPYVLVNGFSEEGGTFVPPTTGPRRGWPSPPGLDSATHASGSRWAPGGSCPYCARSRASSSACASGSA